MHSSGALRRLMRLARGTLARVSDDPLALERLSRGPLRLAARLPGRAGMVATQTLLLFERRLDGSARALADFARDLEALEPGSICIDLGANVGEITQRFVDAGATVHAFEPDPWAFARLRARFGDTPSVVLHNAAVSDADGTTTLYRAADADSNTQITRASSIVACAREGSVVPHTVPCVDFLRFLETLDRDVAIVKMDIEGAEVAVLERLRDAPVSARIGAIYVETHYNLYPEQLPAIARLRRAFAARARPRVDFDWP